MLTTPEFLARATSITLDKSDSQANAVLRNTIDNHFRLISLCPNLTFVFDLAYYLGGRKERSETETDSSSPALVSSNSNLHELPP